jgi:hypothetical protein
MDSEVTNLAAVKAFATTDYATAAQGTTADAALPKAGGAMTGAITTNSTFDGRDVSVDGAKLDAIEASADVTDVTNVTAAGALMDSEVTNLAQVKAFDTTDYATSTQGTTADNALPKAGGAMTGAITTTSTFDGRDVATDGSKLDLIEASADVTDTANVVAALSAGTGVTISGAGVVAVSAVALTTVQTAVSQAAQLALTAQEGDVVVRSDENKSYVHNGGTAGTMADYTLLATPTDAVLSVNGVTGAVTAAHIAAAVEAASGSNTFTDADHTKLNAIEASADVTDTTNVTAAGALMDSELAGLAAVKATTGTFLTADQTKLDGIATAANNYVHPTTAGNKHVPTAGAAGQFLKYSASGTAVWAADNNTVYTHPSHPGDDFSVDTGALTGATVVSDIDINVTTDTSGHVTDANGVVSTRTLTLANLGYTGATNANAYTHPTTAGNKHIPTGGTVGQILKNTASGTATWQADNNTTYSVGDGGLSEINFTSADHSKLNGIEAGATADQTAAQILTAVKTVDGSGSGLDADTVDGIQGASILQKSGGTMTGSLTVNQGAIHFQESNSNQDDHSYAIFQEGGAWSHPYPDLRIAYHTGIKIGAHKNYNGTRFYNNSDMVTLLLSVGNGNNDVSATGNITAYASDERLKHKFKPIDNALDKLSKINGVTYEWNPEACEKAGFCAYSSKVESGLKAQEIQKVLPEVVSLAPFDTTDGVDKKSKSGEDYLTIDYARITPLLIEAIKEQQTQIDELKALVQTLVK